ncbi:MAG: hypothetical protein IJ325_02920 [Clostridia bacterium]|nr:hypothetical protein [Clostridia bacterium]
MKTIFDGYRTISAGGRVTYFAGSNTETGFRGLYDDIAEEDRMERVYIIKGGSGTGKSTLMRKIADDAERQGFGCTYYLCGSDPDSLDAVVLDNRIAVLDGTPPHAREMKYPGAASELIDVTRFWDKDVLTEKRESIRTLCTGKQQAFGTAYRYLKAAALLERETYEITRQMVDTDKISGFCRRMLTKAGKQIPPNGPKGKVQSVYTHGIGMQGMVCTDAFFLLTQNHYFIEDAYGTAGCFFDCLTEVCRDVGYDVLQARLPLNDRIAAAVIPALSLSLTVGGEYASDKTIHMTRFLKKEPLDKQKGKLRLANKCMTSLLSDSAESFGEAGKAHFALEKIYVSAMDFTAMNRYTDTVREDILKRLNV